MIEKIKNEIRSINWRIEKLKKDIEEYSTDLKNFEYNDSYAVQTFLLNKAEKITTAYKELDFLELKNRKLKDFLEV